MTRSEQRAMEEVLLASKMAGSSSSSAEEVTSLGREAEGRVRVAQEGDSIRSGLLEDAKGSSEAPTDGEGTRKEDQSNRAHESHERTSDTAGPCSSSAEQTRQSQATGQGDENPRVVISSTDSQSGHLRSLQADSASSGYASTMPTTPAGSSMAKHATLGAMDVGAMQKEPSASTTSSTDARLLATELNLVPSPQHMLLVNAGDETFGDGESSFAAPPVPQSEPVNELVSRAGVEVDPVLPPTAPSDVAGLPKVAPGQPQASPDEAVEPAEATKEIGSARAKRTRGRETPNYAPKVDKEGNLLDSGKGDSKKSSRARNKRAQSASPDKEGDHSAAASPSKSGESKTKPGSKAQAKTDERAPQRRVRNQKNTRGSTSIEISDDDYDGSDKEKSVASASQASDARKAPSGRVSKAVEVLVDNHVGKQAKTGARKQGKKIQSDGEGDQDTAKAAKRKRTTSKKAPVDDLIEESDDDGKKPDSSGGVDQIALKEGKRTSTSKKKRIDSDDEVGESDDDVNKHAQSSGKDEDKAQSENAKDTTSAMPKEAGAVAGDADRKEIIASSPRHSASREVLQEASDANTRTSSKPRNDASTPAKKTQKEETVSPAVSTPCGNSALSRRSETPGSMAKSGISSLSLKLHGRPLGAVLPAGKFRSPGLRRSLPLPALHVNRGPEKAARTSIDTEAVAAAKKRKRRKGYDSDEERKKVARKQRKIAAMTEQQRREYMMRRAEEDYVTSEDEDDDDDDDLIGKASLRRKTVLASDDEDDKAAAHPASSQDACDYDDDDD